MKEVVIGSQEVLKKFVPKELNPELRLRDQMDSNSILKLNEESMTPVSKGSISLKADPATPLMEKDQVSKKASVTNPSDLSPAMISEGGKTGQTVPEDIKKSDIKEKVLLIEV